MSVNPNVTADVSIAPEPSGAICSGTSVTFTASPVNGGSTPVYQWKKNGVNAGTNSTTYTDAGLSNGNIITCVMTSNAVCINGSPDTSNTIVMSVSPIVTANVSIAPVPSGAICSGTSVTFTATPSNGGTVPVYKWKKNGLAVGSNSATYSDNVFINGDQVICEMTSSEACVIPQGATTSNSIVLTVIGCSSVTLNLKVYIEGFYKGNGLMNAVIDSANYPTICDTISVELHNTVSPYNSVEWKRGTISTSGNGSFIFSSSVTGNAYYIVIRQRNGLATWSRNAVLFNNSTVNFDFTRQ